jgi:hypothetical protein
MAYVSDGQRSPAGCIGGHDGHLVLPRRSRPDWSLSWPAHVRLALEELGPTFIKFGQPPDAVYGWFDPVPLAAVLRKARAGRLEVQFVHRNLEHFVREMDRSSNRLSFAIVIGSLVVASALVIQTGVGTTLFGYPLIGLAGFLVAGVLGIGLAIGVIRSGRL